MFARRHVSSLFQYSMKRCNGPIQRIGRSIHHHHGGGGGGKKTKYDFGLVESTHTTRLAVENSWLNWTRNCFIVTVASVAIYSSSDHKEALLLPTKALLGVGLIFMNGGTVIYLGSLLVWENVTAILVLNMITSLSISSMYTFAIYEFVKICDNRIETAENQVQQEEASNIETTGNFVTNWKFW